MFRAIWDWLKRKRVDGTVVEEIGEVQGVAFGHEAIGVQVFNKIFLSDKPLVRLVSRSKYGGQYKYWAIDLTPGEAEKLVSLINKASSTIKNNVF